MTTKRRNGDSADHDLLNNKPVYTIDSLVIELRSSVKNMAEAITESIEINESMGVRLTDEQKDRLNDAVSDMLHIINEIHESGSTRTHTHTRYWVVCEGTFTTYCDTEAAARAKAEQLASAGVAVLRIERQTMTTETTSVCEF